ncbi:MAG: sodium:proton antiporter, partial [Alloprevotella sp.]|nr:sodium:proton antiporter [Alloprevotella sp.]
EQLNSMNKAAVAIFAGTMCWLLYIRWGADFAQAEHQGELTDFLNGTALTSSNVKDFIAGSVFFRYMLEAANVVLFLLATASIVEVLDNNGCFDFIHEALHTKYPKRFLWGVAGITFLVSANLDNLTTVCLMLALMHRLVADERMRWTFGAVIVLAANCGGAFTVIGDTTSLALWTKELVTPTDYSSLLVLPCVTALGTTLALVHFKMPYTMPLVRTLPPYRGDDTVLNRWQRGLMLAVGIGGLWFIPTFHRITHLPPFLGALCVLSVLWIVNELCNRHLLRSDMMVRRRNPLALQYQNIQNILFFIGMTLAVGAVNESGVLPDFHRWTTEYIGNIYIIGIASAAASAVFNNVSVMLGNIAAFSHADDAAFAQNGAFWPLLSYCTAMGGSLMTIGTMGGFALWRMEGVTLRWYVRHFLPKALAGFIAGGLVFWLIS